MSIAFLVICSIIINVINVISNYLEKKNLQNKNASFTINTTLSALILSIKQPLKIFSWLICFYKIFILFDEKFIFLKELKTLLGIIMTLWVCFRFISQYSKIVIQIKEAKKQNVDYGGIDFIKKITQIFITVIVLLFGLGKLGINVQSLVAIGGIGGMAIGFAAKDMLSNIFGGLLIYLDKPFSVGDWISSPDRNIEGDVEEIGWRQTKIVTFSKYPIYISNSVFSNIIIENRSRMRSRRIYEPLLIRYTDIKGIDKIIKEIKLMLSNHSNINQRLTTIVALDSIDSKNASLKIILYTFTNTIEWVRFTEIKQDVLLKCIDIIKNNGCELSYNMSDIFLHDDYRQEEKSIIIDSNNSSDVF